MGFKNFTPPYLNPNTTGDVVLKCVNYASFGSGILNSTGSVFVRLSLSSFIYWLKSSLQELTTNLAGSTFVYLDLYAISEDTLQNYKSYGFENAESACCQVIGQHGGLVPCESFSRVCRDRTKYVFWEPFHPTETANLITAKHALDGGLNYVSPINIRQLTNS
ncbi:hypothetical protein POUND7_003120 [Theobroma cacao]